MNALPFASLLFYAIVIVIEASASCPCHIPCNDKAQTCTCFGTCGDDGYGCKRHGDDYDFLSQIQCREGEWQVQCIRQSKCSIADTVDDTNPYAAYEQTVNNLMIESFDEETASASSAATYSWFGGNWFDFWGQNSAQFFSVADDVENEMKDSANMKNDDITIDQPGFDASQSTQRTLQNVKSSHSHVLDDLGRNEAGYKIIALPLYILILCIVASAILGMLMCAGFVYCGLNCCCPLPPTSPILSAQQRTANGLLHSLTLGGSAQKSYDAEHSVYHRMRNALHNPTNDEESSILSNEVDEYQDSEDDFKEDMVTRGGLDDEYGAITMGKDEERKEPVSLYGKSASDIDQDSEDSMIEKLSNLIETQVFDARSYKDIDIEEEEEEKEIIEETTPTQHDQNSLEDEMASAKNAQYEIELQIDGQEEEEESGDEEYHDDDNEVIFFTENEGTPLLIQNNDDDDDDATEYTENEGTPLIQNDENNDDRGANSGSKSSALP